MQLDKMRESHSNWRETQSDVTGVNKDGASAMPLRLHDSEARGRVIAAGRMLAGLDQTALAIAARVSPSTISNVERGRIEARGATLRAIRRALRDEGVTINVDLTNTLMTANASFEPLDD